MSPLVDWLRRRESAGQARFSAAWSPGVLVGIPVRGKVFGVLLDAMRADGAWEGWLTAPEADWAGYYDVLLEPEDEPWDPLCGVVQAWNRVTVHQGPERRVLGVLSGARLDAVRRVHKAFGLDQIPRVAPRPGHVALRPAGDTQWVLTGTPLSPDDVRQAYQALYREVARHIR